MSPELVSKLYAERKEEIERRLLEFKEVLGKPDESVFEELAYCILTAGSSARAADRAIRKLKENGLLLRGRAEEIERFLAGVLYSREKASRIVKARAFFSTRDGIAIKSRLPADPRAARDFLAENVEGIGYKEASHFLRNVGYGGLAILDRHVLKGLCELSVISEVPRSLTRKRYLKIEEAYLDFAEKVGIRPEALDLVLWSAKTGEVLK
ncbi:MAG: N-glycosylase/DNA lyase [Candidatus Brockarchaeota archaeon]|nr:N-glycosylase/DNA lyase [Candidatus Brockarchaeota archaeon]